MGQAEVNNVNDRIPFNSFKNGGISGCESKPVPGGKVDEGGELDDGELVSVDGEVGLGVGHGGEELAAADTGGAGDEGAEKGAGEALVAVAVLRGDVVEDPEDLLGERGVVGFDGVGAVDKQLLHAIGVAEVGAEGFCGGGEAGPGAGAVSLVLVHHGEIGKWCGDNLVQGWGWCLSKLHH